MTAVSVSGYRPELRMNVRTSLALYTDKTAAVVLRHTCTPEPRLSAALVS